MNVLSLFDGMSCGQIALERAGIKVNKYYSAEIDKPAIKVAKANFPGTLNLGNVVNWRKWGIDWSKITLLIAGSPCQGFSFAGNQLAFDDPRSKLFFVFVDILNHIKKLNPDVKFLLENVKMTKENRDIITQYLGIEPTLINSSLVSAQNRERYYWANWEFGQPYDKNIHLIDILQDEVDVNLYHSQKALDYMNRRVKDGRNHWDFAHHSDVRNDKSAAVVAMYYKGVPYNVLIVTRGRGKFSGGIRGKNGKTPAISANAWQQNNHLLTSYMVRRFTPIECERLQTVPDNYTNHVSNTQRYKMLDNGWTVDAVAHIFSKCPLARRAI